MFLKHCYVVETFRERTMKTTLIAVIALLVCAGSAMANKGDICYLNEKGRKICSGRCPAPGAQCPPRAKNLHEVVRVSGHLAQLASKRGGRTGVL